MLWKNAKQIRLINYKNKEDYRLDLHIKLLEIPKMTERIYVTSNRKIKPQSTGASPSFENFPRWLFPSQRLSSSLLAFPWRIQKAEKCKSFLYKKLIFVKGNRLNEKEG